MKHLSRNHKNEAIGVTMPPLTNAHATELIPAAQTAFAFKLYQILSDPENQYVSKLLI